MQIESPDREEIQQENTNPKDVSTGESVPTNADIAAPKPSDREKAQKVRRVAAMLISVFLVLILLVTSSMAYAAYQLNSRLVATQGELAKLQADYEKQTTELDQVKSELDAVKEELSTTKVGLEEASTENEKLQEKLDSVGKYASFLDSLFLDSKIAKEKIQELNKDSELVEIFNFYESAEDASEEKIISWLALIKKSAEQIYRLAQ